MALLYYWMKHCEACEEDSEAGSSDSEEVDELDTVENNTMVKEQKPVGDFETVTKACENKKMVKEQKSVGRYCKANSCAKEQKNIGNDGAAKANVNGNKTAMVNLVEQSCKSHERGDADGATLNVSKVNKHRLNTFQGSSIINNSDEMELHVAVECSYSTDVNENIIVKEERKKRHASTKSSKEEEKYNNEKQNVEFLPCLICQTTFDNKPELMRHMTKIHRLTNVCQICYFDDGEIKRFANPVSLRNHKVRKHPEDMVKCVCGAMLIDNKMLTSHLKKFKCNIFETGKEASEMAKCICGKRFGSQEMLLNHRSKCRKRDCLDDDFFSEYVTESKQKKKRCLGRSLIENSSAGQTKALGGFNADMNNNLTMSEESDTSSGRASRLRKCKENILTYSEMEYDKLFETVVNPVLDTNPVPRKSQSESTARYETRAHKFPETVGSSLNMGELLDLRTKSVLDRNSNDLYGNQRRITDQNNNSVDSRDLVKMETDDKFSGRMNKTKKTGKKKIENVVEKLKLKMQVKTEPGTSESLKLAPNIEAKAKRLSKTKPGGRSSKKSKKSGGNTKSEKGKKKGRKKMKPDEEGRYPCKKCRKRYKRPYLYIHQKYAHAPRQWIIVPTSMLNRKPETTVSYRCGWCRFLTRFWTSGVHHHYSEHQHLELDLISLSAVQKDHWNSPLHSHILKYF